MTVTLAALIMQPAEPFDLRIAATSGKLSASIYGTLKDYCGICLQQVHLLGKKVHSALCVYHY